MKKSSRRIFYVTLTTIVALIVGASLLVANAPDQQAMDIDFYTACRLGNVEEAKGLIQKGANPNTTVGTESSPPSFWEKLLHIFSPPFPRQHDFDMDETPLVGGARSPHSYAMIKMLMENGANMHQYPEEDTSLLFWCARNGDLESVKYVLSKGVNINTSLSMSFTPLQGAVLSNNAELVKYMIDHGAVVDQGSISMANDAIGALLKKAGSKP